MHKINVIILIFPVLKTSDIKGMHIGKLLLTFAMGIMRIKLYNAVYMDRPFSTDLYS